LLTVIEGEENGKVRGIFIVSYCIKSNEFYTFQIVQIIILKAEKVEHYRSADHFCKK
jgi:hypothetical protein